MVEVGLTDEPDSETGSYIGPTFLPLEQTCELAVQLRSGRMVSPVIKYRYSFFFVFTFHSESSVKAFSPPTPPLNFLHQKFEKVPLLSLETHK
jgi:hypothetical protein